MIIKFDVNLQHNAHSFLCIYRICGDHAVLMREFGTSQIAVVPESLDGRPATEIGEYCFSASNRLEGEYLKEYEFICGLSRSDFEDTDERNFLNKSDIGANETEAEGLKFNLKKSDIGAKEIEAEGLKFNLKKSDIGAKEIEAECLTLNFKKSDFVAMNYHELCGEYVTEIELPDSVTSVGNYCFYGCRRLSKLTIGAALMNFGTGAFMNCTRLKNVMVNAHSAAPTGLKFMLDQLNQGVNVIYSDGTFYYPEYTESYEEIGPAHIFALNLEGEGYRARKCFNDGIIDIARYDDVFEKASAMESVSTLFMMAIGRLKSPIALKSESEERYTKYLKENGKQIIELIVKAKDRETLDFICKMRILDAQDYVFGQKMCVESGWAYGSSRILTMDEEEKAKKMAKKGAKRHVQTESEWQEDIGRRITQYVRGEIYLDLRYMESSLTALVPAANPNVSVYATDGMYIYFNADKLCSLLKSNVRFLQRVYLHSVLHCIYLHLWTRGGRNNELWNLACDISVEYIIDKIDKPCTRRILSWTRSQLYDEMNSKGIVSAPQIYNMILTKDSDMLARWSAEFYADDHIYWENGSDVPHSAQESPQDVAGQWEDRARQDELKRRSQGGDGSGEDVILAAVKRRNRYSYREFLKRFTQLREEMRINPDEFDMTMYSYGLRTYGRIPLIEPQETRESRKIYEFVIVLDTSYSTSGELIAGFLDETLSILTSDNAFFEKIRLHIIQCDDKVTRDIVVDSIDDIENMFEKFEIKGGGNTDFRPAFNYVNECIERGVFDNLGGMIYFTDGRGIYPMKNPSYKTAFVYFKEIDLDNAPAWAVTYRIGE